MIDANALIERLYDRIDRLGEQTRDEKGGSALFQLDELIDQAIKLDELLGQIDYNLRHIDKQDEQKRKEGQATRLQDRLIAQMREGHQDKD